MQLLHIRCGPCGCVLCPACPSRGGKKGPDWPGLQEAMEENMISISITFTRAASGKARIDPGFNLFWVMVFAVVIDDDAQRSEKEQRKKRTPKPAPAKPKPKPPAGPS